MTRMADPLNPNAVSARNPSGGVGKTVVVLVLERQ